MRKTELQELEEQLLTIDTRRSRDELDRLIADDFKEFGSSGRIWSKDDVLEELPSQQSLGGAEILEFEELELSKEHVFVTYLLSLDGIKSLRSSIWRRRNEEWEVIFHQGTRSGE